MLIAVSGPLLMDRCGWGLGDIDCAGQVLRVAPTTGQVRMDRCRYAGQHDDIIVQLLCTAALLPDHPRHGFV